MKPLSISLLAFSLLGCIASTLISSSNSSSLTCLGIEAGYSSSFGHALAVSDRYLAIGDPGANRVVVYRLNTNKQWSRIQEIHPPQDSIIAQAGVSFGYDLDFDDGVLVIGAYSQVALETDGTNQDFGAIYSIAFLSSMRYSLKP